ncbi:hypothetical protein [uncultured Bartonella sp.]|uniref:hypothetical protein n=1 Tax=uncultured Bartonella sp. TaxID=104108 RepID=UPI00262BC74D|nr:hypothetical protein [uncultured Bartonella sp.]
MKSKAKRKFGRWKNTFQSKKFHEIFKKTTLALPISKPLTNKIKSLSPALIKATIIPSFCQSKQEQNPFRLPIKNSAIKKAPSSGAFVLFAV